MPVHRPQIFISYCRADEDLKKVLVRQFGALQSQGLVDLWTDDRIETGTEWRADISHAVEQANIAILLVSADFLNSRYIQDHEVPALLHRRTEVGLRIFAIIAKPCAWQTVSWLEPLQVRDLTATSGFAIDFESCFAGVVTEVYKLVASPPSRTRVDTCLPPPPDKVLVGRLPVADRAFIGREAETGLLRHAWQDSNLNVVCINGWGGIGKSALVKHWLIQLEKEDFGCAERVYAWSFAQQGVSERSCSGDDFVAAALEWFGDLDPSRGSAWAKGERLAGLIRSERTLLILDGLEPLQRPTRAGEGKLNDESIQALLRELAAYNRGMCIVTSRLSVVDVADYESTTVCRIDLGDLPVKEGAMVLRAHGAKGTEPALEEVSAVYRGHPLGLVLLARYIRDAYGGDIDQWKEVDVSRDLLPSGPAESIMVAYERWFGDGPEVDLLHILGLFDRPADESAVATVRAAPPIPGLTEKLQGMSGPEWRLLVARLRHAKLLLDEDPQKPAELDAHPLVRRHFREQLRSRGPDAWHEGNRRLYEYYKSQAKAVPATLVDMEPLFKAVAHGCSAGRHHDALHEVYLPRIVCGEPAYVARRLGAYGALASVLANFCEDGDWSRPYDPQHPTVQGLAALDQLTVLTQAGLFLTSIKGYAAEEVRACYRKVHELSLLNDQPVTLYTVLISQWRNSMVTAELGTTLHLAKELRALAKRQDNPALLVGAYRAVCVIEFFMGRFSDAEVHASFGVELWEAGAYASPVDEVYAPVITCLTVHALALWHHGYPARARERMEQAVQLARELSDFYALAAPALLFACYLDHFLRDGSSMLKHANELVHISNTQGFKLWSAAGHALHGYALGISGEAQRGLAALRVGVQQFLNLGAELNVSFFLILEAELLSMAGQTSEALLAVERALQFATRFSEGWWTAEIHRWRGDLLLRTGNEPGAVQEMLTAREVAAAQGSVSLEFRACLSLTLKGDTDARNRLGELCELFENGVETPDLEEARRLLLT